MTHSKIFLSCGFVFFCLGVLCGISGTDHYATFFIISSTFFVLGILFGNKERKEDHMDQTLEYYNENAESFAEATKSADMSEARNRFLSYVPEGGAILDWGCGSGRDILAFKESGYLVEATDASEELCRIASEYTGIEVIEETFDELAAQGKYDGIWACASLLHIAWEDLPKILKTAEDALKIRGVLYMSFKYGTAHEERNGRYFTDLDEASMASLLKENDNLKLVEEWISDDVRADRTEKWLNVIVRRMK